MSPPIKHIWIDQICINQADTSERSSQVRLMKKIYSQAIRTLIWLGPELGSSSTAWEFVDHIYNVFRTQNPDIATSSDIPPGIYSNDSHTSLGLPEWNDVRWTYLRDLVGLDWFSRIWVIQEVVLSPKDPIILHGKVSYRWHRLAWVAAWMRRSGYTRLADIPQNLLNVDTISNLRHPNRRWPLDALLSYTQNKFHATDQRDKIYGLLGLAAESQEPSQLPDPLRPDYESDVREVYLRVARFLTEKSGSLSLWSRAYGARRSSLHLKLPSWCPDWSDLSVSNSELEKSLSWVHFQDTTRPAYLGFPEHYLASAGLKLKHHKVADNSKFRLSGMVVDRVIRVAPFNADNSSRQKFDEIFESQLIRVLEEAMTLLKEKEITSWANSFVKTTSAEHYNLGGRTWDQCFKDGLSFLYDFLLRNEALMSLFLSQCGNERASDLLFTQSRGGIPEKYAALARNFCFGRSFIITSRGKMGIGPLNTLANDTVSIIPGGNVPYILRRQGSGWKFVGESYIAALINGDAIRSCQYSEEILELW